jgi:plasmid stability protein
LFSSRYPAKRKKRYKRQNNLYISPNIALAAERKKTRPQKSPLAGLKERFVLDNNPIWLHNDFILKPIGGVYMATVTVKNIPDELYDRLKSVAEINRRSINSEIIMCIENTVLSRRINLDEVLENARQLRQLTAGHLISDEDFNQAKGQGRL